MWTGGDRQIMDKDMKKEICKIVNNLDEINESMRILCIFTNCEICNKSFKKCPRKIFNEFMANYMEMLKDD